MSYFCTKKRAYDYKTVDLILEAAQISFIGSSFELHIEINQVEVASNYSFSKGRKTNFIHVKTIKVL